jgi:acetyltransferase-like isoleucine patch superfamily enzyme
MKKALDLLANSPFTQVVITLIVYALYGTLVGLSLVPSMFLLWYAWQVLMTATLAAGIVIFSICCGLALFLYFITGAVVLGLALRIITLGIKPGRYPFVSFVMVRWLVYSGIYQLATTTILAHVPVSFVGNLFFRLFGAKLGKNVKVNTSFLNDAYLLEIGDDVVIGGKTDISCHSIERGTLILRPVKIGSGTLIGQGCYISPGVTIGSNCVIGQYAFLRKNAVVPDRAIMGAIGAMPIRAVTKIEKGGFSRMSVRADEDRGGPGSGEGGSHA